MNAADPERLLDVATPARPPDTTEGRVRLPRFGSRRVSNLDWIGRVGAGKIRSLSGDHDVTSAAELFDLLWESLADVLGTAATATLLRRAIKRAVSHTAGSEPVVVTRAMNEGTTLRWVLLEALRDYAAGTWTPRPDRASRDVPVM